MEILLKASEPEAVTQLLVTMWLLLRSKTVRASLSARAFAARRQSSWQSREAVVTVSRTLQCA